MKTNRILTGLALVLIGHAASAATAQLRPTRYLNFNGVRIAAYQGPGNNGPGILLIHGNTSAADFNARIFRPLAATGARVAAIDLPGFGKSDNAPSYTAGYFANAIAFAAKKLNVDCGVIVGWSLGGDFALQAAQLLPKARGYFLIGTAPVGYAPTLPAPFLSPDQSPAGPAVNYGFVANLTPAQVNEYVQAFFRPGYTDVPAYLFADGRRADPATRAAVGAAAAGFDPSFRDEVAIVRGLKVPVALVQGDDDGFVNPAFVNALAPSIPKLWQRKVIYLPNTGHAAQWERPLLTLLLIDGFINSLPSP